MTRGQPTGHDPGRVGEQSDRAASEAPERDNLPDARQHAEADVAEAYRVVLRRDPDEAGLSHFGELLASGQLTLAELYRAILESQEYHALVQAGAMSTPASPGSDPSRSDAPSRPPAEGRPPSHPKPQGRTRKDATGSPEDGEPDSPRDGRLGSGRFYLERRIVALTATSLFGTWGFALMQRVLETCFRRVHVTALDLGSTLREMEADEPDVAHLLVSEDPGPALLAGVADPNVPVIAFVDDPVAAVVHLLKGGMPGTDAAIRALSRSLSGIVSVGLTRPILVVSRTGPSIDTREILTRIGAHLLAVTGDPVFGIFLARVERLGSEPIPLETALAQFLPLYDSLETSRSALSREDAELVELCLGGLVRSAEGAPLSVVWLPALFFLGDSHEPATPVTDVAGRARVLYFGPYLCLPIGTWKAKVTLAFSKGAVGTNFLLSMRNPDELFEVRVTPRESGIYTAHLNVAISEHHRANEFLIRTDQGAIEGRVGLLGIEFTGDPAASKRDASTGGDALEPDRGAAGDGRDLDHALAPPRLRGGAAPG